MRLPTFTTPARWLAGIGFAALMLAGLASQALEIADPVPLSFAPADPAVLERIRAFEAGTERRSVADPLSFDGPDGRPIYLFIAGCCDQFNKLYDADGRFICAPSGGFAGSGDGKCPAWVQDESRWRRARVPGPRPQQPWPPR